MKPFLTGSSLRKLCIARVIRTSDYWALKKLKRLTHTPIHERFNFNLDAVSEKESLLLFRFSPSQIKRLQKALRIPSRLRLQNRTKFSGIERLCILLRRLSYPNRLSDLIKLFGRDATSLSRISTFMTDLIYSKHKDKMSSLNQPWIINNLEKFSEACVVAGSLFPNIVGFIDGSSRPICRPKRNQKQQYSGYYKEHVVKYQSIMLPNGIIGRLDGPFNENRHDSAILHLSKALDEMEHVFVNEDGTWYTLYGDAGYANQKFVKVGFKNHAKLNNLQKQFNFDMSALRVSVEYGFGKIVQQFAFLDFKKNQKLLLQPVKKQYFVGAILANCHTCINSNQISKYFNCNPPELEEYLK